MAEDPGDFDDQSHEILNSLSEFMDQLQKVIWKQSEPLIANTKGRVELRRRPSYWERMSKVQLISDQCQATKTPHIHLAIFPLMQVPMRLHHQRLALKKADQGANVEEENLRK
eukprot:TRINITY_DN12641_c0_g1_i11.p4 TRINITY_DN12641_c0_g1~~TRINITY_DN12641_c0_g1_i11.p4  ORF type:complete len:113 (+),score=3.88 TRINITY_DN12641_c0_g1_i11:127-465(+)